MPHTNERELSLTPQEMRYVLDEMNFSYFLEQCNPAALRILVMELAEQARMNKQQVINKIQEYEELLQYEAPNSPEPNTKKPV